MEIEERCDTCEFSKCLIEEEPCINCCHSHIAYDSKFEPKRNAVKIVVEVRKINDIINKIDEMTIGMNVWPGDIVRMLEKLKHDTKEVEE